MKTTKAETRRRAKAADVLRTIGDIYDIEIRTRRWVDNPSLCKHFYDGPAGGGYCPRCRMVWCGPHWTALDIAVLGLHELMHCIMHHPRFGPNIPEAYVLIPVEYAVFATYFGGDVRTWRSFDSYQGAGTFDGTYTISDIMGDTHGFRYSKFQSCGLSTAATLGVLHRGRLTGRRPRWSNLPSGHYDRWLKRATDFINTTFDRLDREERNRQCSG